LKDSEDEEVVSSFDVSLDCFSCEWYKFVIPTINASNTCAGKTTVMIDNINSVRQSKVLNYNYYISDR